MFEPLIPPIKDVTEDDMDKLIAEGKPVIIDFWAPWCGPCRMVEPVLAELQAEFNGKITVVKVNVDQHPHAATKFNITSIPKMLFFNNETNVHEITGASAKKDLKSTIIKAFKFV